MLNRKKSPVFSLVGIMLLSGHLSAQGVRPAVYAGMFYESRPDVLSRQIDMMLEKAEVPPLPLKNLQAIIVPHAGYVYSGPVAAYGYRLVQGRPYATAIIIGPSHRHGFKGCSIYLKGGYETPLGIVPVDEELARKISQASGFSYIPAAHKEEHSIEVQIPFIQKTLPQAKIVPILIGISSRDTISMLADALKKTLPGGQNTLLIISTDLSHYLPKAKAAVVDNDTISLIKALDIDTLTKKVERHENIMCGGCGVISALTYARSLGTPKVEILRYSDSAPGGGAQKKVVGYVAAAVYSDPSSQKFSLSDTEKQELLKVARSAVNLYIQKKEILRYSPQSGSLFSERGAFVTLKKKGRLRGCIGYIEAVAPLHLVVTQAAIFAASQDNRFPPVQPSELKDLEYEISVLTPPRRIESPEEVVVGQHGLIIAQGNRKGVLLPQVPVENQWSRKTFLEQACLKAGLPPAAWESGAEVFVFEAIVFH